MRKLFGFGFTLFLVVAVLFFSGALSVNAQTVGVSAMVETDSVPGKADDPAIWVHPDDPARSIVFGTDKRTGLFWYDLQGNEIGNLALGRVNNADVIYNSPLAGETVDLVGFNNRDGKKIHLYKIYSTTRQLIDVAANELKVRDVYGFCFYRSPVTEKFYAFVPSRSS